MSEQKWMYANTEFAVGDKVMVVRFATDEDDKGGMGWGNAWDNVWVDDMDEAINPLLVFEISDIQWHGARFHLIEGVAASEYAYPLSVLHKVVQ